MEIKDTILPTQTYLVWRKEIDIKNIMDQNMWQTAFGKVHEYVQAQNLNIVGPGVALYFRWNQPEGKGEIGIGNPVKGAGEVNDPDLSIVPLAESKAVMATVHGTYDTFPQHHASLGKHLQDHNLKETLTIEEYVVTGMDKPDPKEWQTNLYHLYE